MRLTPHTTALLAFLVFYCILLIDIHHWGARDPGSAFFDPATAFERIYSDRREQEAEKYIISSTAPRLGKRPLKAAANPTFCVGIPTVQRDGARYFRRAMGSLLAGLTARERKDLYIMPFVVNVDPEEHMAFHEPWLEVVADEVLTYRGAGDEVLAQLGEAMQNDVNTRKKALFDYTHMMEKCAEKNTEWILLVEDDTVAADGWYKRTVEATRELQRRSDFQNTLYLRLFYNERLLGWNSEEWFTYTLRSILFEAAIFTALILTSAFLPQTRQALTPLTILTTTFLVGPLLITAFFLAGRLTVAGPSRGLNKMNAYGCCSQAFVFPRHQIPSLLSFYDQARNGYIDPDTGADKTQIDSLTEIYAERHGLERWALTPSVFQHVGGQSTKPTSITRWGRSNAENIWNFGFERLDGEELGRMHYE